MSIGAASGAQAAAQNAQNIEVLSKAHDHQKVEGEAAKALIDSTAQVTGEAPPTGDHTGAKLNVFA